MRRNIIDDDGVYLFIKHPDEAAKVYTVDWTDRLEGRTIASVSAPAPTGLTVLSSYNATATQHTISGGTNATDYNLTVAVVTSTGETLVAPIRVRVTTAPYYKWQD